MSDYTISIFDASVGWENDNFLGEIWAGEVSEFYVKAIISTATVDLTYALVDGNLPAGMTLNRDGTISGFAEVKKPFTSGVSTSTSYNFTIYAQDNTQNIYIGGDFSITVYQNTSTDFTDVFAKPLLSDTKRSQYRTFINNKSIFLEDLIYRPLDSNFGVQKDLKIVLGSRIENYTIREYAEVLADNFKRQRFHPGQLKTAYINNPDGSIRYEIVYLEIQEKFNTTKKYLTSEGKEIAIGGLNRPNSLYGTGYRVSLGSVYCPSCVGLATSLIDLRKKPTNDLIAKIKPKAYITQGTASGGSIGGIGIPIVNNPAIASGVQIQISKSATGSKVWLSGGTGAALSICETGSLGICGTGSAFSLNGTNSSLAGLTTTGNICGLSGSLTPMGGITGAQVSLKEVVGRKDIVTYNKVRWSTRGDERDKSLLGAVYHSNLFANSNSVLKGGEEGNKVLMGGTTTRVSLGSVYGTSICDQTTTLNKTLFPEPTDIEYYKELENQPFIPICYALPGKGKIIVNKIKQLGIKFNTFDLDIDRIYLQNPKDTGTTKYLLLNRSLNRL